MRIRGSGIVLGVIAVTFMSPGPLLGQGAALRPEYFGFYGLDGDKLLAIGDGKSDTPPVLQQVAVAVLGSTQPVPRSAVEVGASVHFLLFDVAPAEAARALSIYRLPFLRNEITVSDVAFLPGSPGPTARQRNLPGMMRLATSQIRLLQKPVPAQPQMIELVPDPALPEGLYGVLYAPATALTTGGAGAGQNAGWTALLVVGQASTASQNSQCIDLILTGGLGGMIGIDSPDTGRIASFPLLDPGRTRACSSAGTASNSVAAPRPPVAPSSASANSADLVSLVAALERGEVVDFKIRYTDSAWTRSLAQQDGLVTVSKERVTFQPTVGSIPFSVSPKKILELINEPQQANRIRLKVAIPNKKGDKEESKNFEFYHPGTFINGLRIGCASCDDSMSVLHAVLQKARGY